MITLEELKATAPKHVKTYVSQDMVNVLNEMEGEHGIDYADTYKQNLLSLSTVLKSGSYSTKEYINASQFVSFKLLQHTDIDAYMLTFPDRYKRLMDKWLPELGSEAEVREKKISPFVSAYKRTELVQKLMERALMPSRVLNAPLFQEALNVQATLMHTARSEMVRMSAANSVMQYTAPNESTKIELDIGVKDGDEIQALRDEMQRLALQQQQAIAGKALSAGEIASRNIVIDVEEA
jgi:hypothetical protein